MTQRRLQNVIVEFRHGLDIIQLDANELMKLMEFVVQFEQIIVETSGAKIARLCLDYDPNEKEET